MIIQLVLFTFASANVCYSILRENFDDSRPNSALKVLNYSLAMCQLETVLPSAMTGGGVLDRGRSPAKSCGFLQNSSKTYVWCQCDDLHNLVEICQVVPDILKILVNPRWRLCRLFGSSSKVKTHREHICSPSATPCKIW